MCQTGSPGSAISPFQLSNSLNGIQKWADNNQRKTRGAAKPKVPGKAHEWDDSVAD